ncbi:unnamed protein product [Linum trigynum]|uniref:Uncharacterized protein n=1 Tax=Linum trigynum TaxID=586398 RepID=A0AAV2D7H9_9ROSI
MRRRSPNILMGKYMDVDMDEDVGVVMLEAVAVAEILVVVMVVVKVPKAHFSPEVEKMMVGEARNKVFMVTNTSKMCVTVVVEKVIGLVPVVRQNTWLTYQESLKGKKIETNCIFEEDDSGKDYNDATHLDVFDFFAHPEGKIDHLIGDGNVCK